MDAKDLTDDTDPLFATHRLAEDGTRRRSVVVVGLPRSGSSFLSHILSQMPDWYVFDDLYLAREAETRGFTGTLDAHGLSELLIFLKWQIWARKRHGLYAVPNVEEDELVPMNDALKTTFEGAAINWWDLQEEWLVRLAARGGAVNWGYKMPGAFRDLDRLLTTYPAMKAVFLMRAPERVLASYKHMPEGHADGDPAQYHPVFHALYWRAAAQAWQRAKARWPDRIHLLRFEDMVADPTATAAGLAAFLGTDAPGEVTAPPRANSSFAPTGRRDLSPLEHRIVARITGSARRALGFAPLRDAPDGLAGAGELLTTSGRFLTYRTGQKLAAWKRRYAGPRNISARGQ